MPVRRDVMAAPSGYNGDVEERQVIELEPDRITIYADVEARFEAVKTEVETQS